MIHDLLSSSVKVCFPLDTFSKASKSFFLSRKVHFVLLFRLISLVYFAKGHAFSARGQSRLVEEAAASRSGGASVVSVSARVTVDGQHVAHQAKALNPWSGWPEFSLFEKHLRTFVF